MPSCLGHASIEADKSLTDYSAGWCLNPFFVNCSTFVGRQYCFSLNSSDEIGRHQVKIGCLGHCPIPISPLYHPMHWYLISTCPSYRYLHRMPWVPDQGHKYFWKSGKILLIKKFDKWYFNFPTVSVPIFPLHTMCGSHVIVSGTCRSRLRLC